MGNDLARVYCAATDGGLLDKEQIYAALPDLSRKDVTVALFDLIKKGLLKYVFADEVFRYAPTYDVEKLESPSDEALELIDLIYGDQK